MEISVDDNEMEGAMADMDYKKMYKYIKEFKMLISKARIGIFASSAAFFLFLSIIPVIMVVSSLIPESVLDARRVIGVSQAVIPEKIYSFLLGIVESYHGNEMTLLSFSAIIAVWSASKGMLAMIRGLNHIYEVKENGNYIFLRFKAIMYTIFLLLAIVLAVGILLFGNSLLDFFMIEVGMISLFWKFIGAIRHVFVACMISVLFCTMYFLLPNNHLEWGAHYPGAVFTSVFWTLFSLAFSVYIDYFDGFSMYGSLTTIVIVMIWLYACMYIFFCGALVNKWIDKK